MTDPAAAQKGPRGLPRAALVVVGLAGIGLIYAVFANPPAAPPRSANDGPVMGHSGIPARNFTLNPRQKERFDAIRAGKHNLVDAQGKPIHGVPEAVQKEISARQAAEAAANAPDAPAAGTPMDPATEARMRGDITAAMTALQPHLRDCYQAGLKQTPALAGAVTLAFSLQNVDGGGSARASDGAVANTTLGAPSVETCMLTQLQGLSYPALHVEGDVKVRYPFRLSPDQPTPHP